MLEGWNGSRNQKQWHLGLRLQLHRNVDLRIESLIEVFDQRKEDTNR